MNYVGKTSMKVNPVDYSVPGGHIKVSKKIQHLQNYGNPVWCLFSEGVWRRVGGGCRPNWRRPNRD